MTAPLLESVEDLEYDEPCGWEFCDSPAEWLVGLAHACYGPNTGFVCDMHKDYIEKNVLRNLRHGKCACGHLIAGQLSDHFSAIRL